MHINLNFSEVLTVLIGFLASVAHVATGPDHLAAVTPLAIDSRKKSWVIGFSWGFGHTVGMLLIGSLFLAFKEFLPIDSISKYSETIIGILLVGIGIWALKRGYSKHSHDDRPHAHFHATPNLYAHVHSHSHASPSIEGDLNEHGHSHTTNMNQNVLSAFFIGTVHGLAGFSHLFALLPSLAFPSFWSSVVYIVAFAVGTIFTMMTFAFSLGLLAHRAEAGGKELFLKRFSLTGAILAIAIGILWIIHPIG